MTEQHKNRLKEAIDNLPSLNAPDNIWLAINEQLDNQMESGKENLAKAMSQMQLSDLEAPDIWEGIAANLPEEHNASDEILEKAILELPEARLPGDVFEEVIDQVAQQKKSKWFAQPNLKWAAAVVVLLTATWTIFNKDNGDRQVELSESISYSEEITDEGENLEVMLSAFQQDDEVLALVEATCLPIEIKCENPEFKGLLIQYKELEDVKHNLIEEIKVHQDQSQLVDYLVRVEKEKTEIGKKLIHYLLS